MNVRFMSFFVAIGVLAGMFFLTTPSLAESPPARTTPTQSSPIRVPPPEETQRLRALKATFVATRQLAIDQAYLDKIAASPVALPSKLTMVQVAELKQIGQLARRDDHAALGRRWGAFAADLPLGTTPTDVTALIEWVLRESYLQRLEELRFDADMAKHFDHLKSQLRSELDSARSKKPEAQTRGSVTLRVVSRLPVYRTGAVTSATIPMQEMTLTPAELDREIAKIETMLKTVGEDAQMAEFELQNQSQKKQQALQMMSRISKLLHDALMSIIKKIA